jgi:transcriptional regulator with XRE-family HTH domain
MTLAEKFKTIRTEKKFSQKQVALDGGLRQNYVSQIESGDIKTPSEEKLEKLAKGVQLNSWKDLLDGVENGDQITRSTERGARAWCLNRDCPEVEWGWVHESGESGHKDVFETPGTNGGRKFISKFASFPAIAKDGKPNEFCPFCGQGLITACPRCQRPFENAPSMKFCMGCGTELPFFAAFKTAGLDQQPQFALPRPSASINDDDVPF